MKKEFTACFTGHREIEDLFKAREGIRKASADLVKRGVTHFLVGGATGFDINAGELIFMLREDTWRILNMIRLTVVLPCSFKVFTQKWSEEERKRLRSLMRFTNKNIIMQKAYSPDCYKMRNQYLVDNSRYCICYYDESRFRSGTGQTVRMAEKQGLEIINLFGNLR
ncbi:MAG: DUF1273 domain-containing protein [Oscillospiraceae bacterium]|nr:DUF1273 domain-containing protein [Oscillospiraceae bacterium]